MLDLIVLSHLSQSSNFQNDHTQSARNGTIIYSLKSSVTSVPCNKVLKKINNSDLEY